MRDQARLSVMCRGAAIRPQAERNLAPFSGPNVHAPRSGKLPDEEVRTCRQLHKLNGGVSVEAWWVVEGSSILIKVVLFSYLGYFFQPRP